MLYAVGDIHGEVELLEELLATLPHREGDRFVFVGDYVDRGPIPRASSIVWSSSPASATASSCSGTTSRCFSTSSAGAGPSTSRVTPS